MNFIDILKPEAVRFSAGCSSKKRLLQDLGDLAESVYGLESEACFNALQDRESLGPTGVGNGIALPHARIDGIERVCGLFLRLEKPMSYDSVDKQPVDLVFALFAPRGGGVDHLKALALVSRTLRDPGVCSKLRANAEPGTLFAILDEGPAAKAA